MKYPKEVQDKINVLNKYTIDKNLSEFDIFHLYPENKPAYPNGFYDSRFFELWGFNTKTMTKSNLGRHDGIISYFNPMPIKMIRIFADGSTFIRFTKVITIDCFQEIIVNS
ncbi:MAG TPA: hypothetical protein VIK84_05705 [Haloplasmataceae bacterium]